MSVQKIDSEPMTKDVIASVLIHGDLSKLNTDQRLSYYTQLCDRLGLDPITRPLEYIKLNGKETLYFRKDATEQLRKKHSITIDKIEDTIIQDMVYVVTAYAYDNSGRRDAAKGAVSILGLKGDALANAIMKAETKAKRRVTLSICGVGFLDESELETIPEVKKNVIIHKESEKEKHKYLDLIETSNNLDELSENFSVAYKYGKHIGDDKFIKALITIKDIKKEEVKNIISPSELVQNPNSPNSPNSPINYED